MVLDIWCSQTTFSITYLFIYSLFFRTKIRNRKIEKLNPARYLHLRVISEYVWMDGCLRLLHYIASKQASKQGCSATAGDVSGFVAEVYQSHGSRINSPYS